MKLSAAEARDPTAEPTPETSDAPTTEATLTGGPVCTGQPYATTIPYTLYPVSGCPLQEFMLLWAHSCLGSLSRVELPKAHSIVMCCPFQGLIPKALITRVVCPCSVQIPFCGTSVVDYLMTQPDLKLSLSIAYGPGVAYMHGKDSRQRVVLFAPTDAAWIAAAKTLGAP